MAEEQQRIRKRDKLKEGAKKLKEKVEDRVNGRVTVLKVSKMEDHELDSHFTFRFFEEAEETFGTGDIVLCRGTERFSQIIRKGTMSTWSHAAILVVSPPPDIRKAYKIPDDSPHKVFVYEADTETHDKRDGGGTQLVPFNVWLSGSFKEYGDNFLVVVRHLQHPNLKTLDWEKLYKWMQTMTGVGYEVHRSDLVFSALHRNRSEDLTTVFCSELVAASYKAMGIFPSNINASNFVPRDFTSDQRLDGRDIQLEGGFTLARELRIKMKMPTATKSEPSLTQVANNSPVNIPLTSSAFQVSINSPSSTN